MTRSIMLACVLTLGMNASAFAQRESIPMQRYCPVLTSQRVGIGHGFEARYRGIKIRLSSREAYIKWLRDPDAYADTEILPQLEGLTLPEREHEQVYCPVYRDRKVSGRDPYVWYEGKRVYLFDTRAVRRFNADTERYLDLDLLPQLRKPPAGDEAKVGQEADSAS